MAKKTKNSNLSLEERMEQALIPNWDEPYKLPENWCWTHWGNCGQFIAGGAFKEKYQGFLGLPIPFYKVGSLKYSNNKGCLYDETNTIDEEIRNQLKVSLIPVNSIIFAKIGEAIRLNRRSLNTIPCCIDNNLMAFVTSDKCYYKYVYYWSKSIDLYEYANATTVPAIRKSDLESIPFPLAPYETQIKIVSQIESLFAKLDEAKEKVQEIVDGFETRKITILHKAFSGELTAKWREENRVELNSWELTNLQDICEKIVCGKTPTEHITEHGEIPFLKVYNIVDNQIDFETAPQFIPESIHHGKLKSSVLKPNDVIMNIVGPPLRKIAVIPDTYPEWNMNQAIVRFRPTKALNYKFLYYALINPETLDDIIAATRGVVGQANISVSQSRALIINMPSWDEQIEVVRILDCIIEKEKCAKDAATMVVEQIERMKKAILACAFRGELGTNDPSEESATELLKSILSRDEQLQISTKKSSKRVSIPSDFRALVSNVREEEIIKLLLKSASQSISIQEIMALSSKKFELMDTLRTLEKKQLITKNELGEYSLTR